jgi:hypothetical protein
MPRPRRFLFLSLAAVVAVLAVGLWLLWPGTAITRENAERIEEGMTLADVEAILGGPARNESDLPENFIHDAFIPKGFINASFANGDRHETQPYAEKRWASSGCVVIVDFDGSWRVIRHCSADLNVDRSLFDKLRRRLGL